MWTFVEVMREQQAHKIFKHNSYNSRILVIFQRLREKDLVWRKILVCGCATFSIGMY